MNKSREGDVESQSNGGPSSPLSPIRSPLARLSWNPRPSGERGGRRSRQQSKDERNEGNALGASPLSPRGRTATDPSSPSMSPTSPSLPATSATLFNTQDRPDLQMMESYAVMSPGSAFGSPVGRSASFNKGIGIFKSPSNRIPRSRSQQRSSTLPKKPGGPPMSADNMISSPIKTDQNVLRIDTTGVAPNQVRRPSPIDDIEPVAGATAADTLPDPLKQRLSELHAQHPHLRALPNPLLPIVPFPGQGAGRLSEFDQDAPLWARQPYKIVYFAYFGLSVGFVFLPWFALCSLFPSKRERASWTWKKSTLVKLYRHGTRLTFRTHTSLSRDLTKEVPHSKTVRAKFVWVDGLTDDLVRGELKRGLEIQGLSCVRTCGFWYGERDGGGGVGQKAAPGEKVVYHLHGGAYWIGTAHENDVTSAVNVQVLKALDKIYTSRLPTKSQSTSLDGRQSPHPTDGPPTASEGALCKRAFSLDYRLCVPGRPEVGSFPAPLADALAGYRYLVQDCEFEPANIIIAGDSAGGNLALAVCRYLRDEKITEMPMPGAMLLLSPWTDTSRSHSGPVSAPNKLSTVHLNRKSDIIASSTAFRNTAVSALLGKMPARETYKNPYLSAISLQLAAKDGGAGPNWGFKGFPRKIYICTGTAEISHDQHLTLAYRLASGSKLRTPIHTGDKCSADADPYEMAARLQYPRPEDHEITLWPSAQNTPSGMPLSTPTNGWEELQAGAGGSKGAQEKRKSLTTKGHGSTKDGDEKGDKSSSEDQEKGNSTTSANSKGLAGQAIDTAAGALDAVSLRIRSADGYFARLPASVIRKAFVGGASTSSTAQDDEEKQASGFVSGRTSYEGEAGTGEKTTEAVKEKDTAASGQATHDGSARRRKKAKQLHLEGIGQPRPTQPTSSELGSSENDGAMTANAEESARPDIPSVQVDGQLLEHADQPSYFDVGGEDRRVFLDECIDGIHDYTLFDWFEPERSQTWTRIAHWIDEEV